jgi:hypothetical protein
MFGILMKVEAKDWLLFVKTVIGLYISLME